MNAINVKELLMSGSGLLVLLLTFIQITPIKLNPWTWLGRMIGRAINGEVLERIDKLEKRMGALETAEAERDTVNARIRILRFGDECREHVRHSKEHWDQTMRDITKYDRYCAAHPEFENDITSETAKYLKELYHNCLVENNFL